MEHTLKKINLTCVKSSDEVPFLGVIIDESLTFKKHIDNLVRKAQYMLYGALQKFLTVGETKKLGNAFIDSQFNYAPLI